MVRSGWIPLLCGLTATGVMACGRADAPATGEAVDPALASRASAPGPSVAGEPLWQVMLEYGTLVAINRPPAPETPSAPIEADLWIISDPMGGYDTMQIAVTVDCQARTYAMRQITTYSGPTLIEAAPAQDTAFQSANPETPYSAMLSHVCDAGPTGSPAADYGDFTEAQAAQQASLA
jgi:hypothetical protein